jgi:hypothetical protein
MFFRVIGFYLVVSGVSLKTELRNITDLTYEEDLSIDLFVNLMTGKVINYELFIQ